MAESTKSVERDEKMRVKLYMLNAGRVWDDQGTGYVSSTIAEKTKDMFLIVKEENKNTVLLESKIQLTTAYQKQQETLIVWSEAENFDYALSFQNKAGCDEVWAQICQVQGKDPSVDVTQDILMEHDDADMDDDRFESMGGSGGHMGGSDGETGTSRLTMVLPACEVARLDDIVELFQSSLPSPLMRERLSDLIEQEGYIVKLVELFRMSEDLEDLPSLRRLYTIFKSLFLLNKSPVFEAMFSDDVIFDVIGALEYDPNLQRVTRHRDFLRRQASLKQAVPFHNPELIQKIHQTYRVQYIQDSILPAPSMFEENMLSTLTSFVYFNKVEIVTHIQEDEKYLQTLFKHLVDDDTDDMTRRNIMSFLKEFCNMSCNLAQQNREEFFRVLSNLGILNALEIILGMDDRVNRWLAVDIFSSLVEFNPSIVRDFFLKEIHKQDDEDLLINMVIEQMFTDLDPELGGALQLIGVIRLLVDPDNMNSTVKNEKTDFLSNFYPHCMHVLTAPLFANTTNDKPSKDDYQTAQLHALILDLLTFCVEHHTYHIKTFMLNKHLLKRSLTLLSSRHGFLQLAALRLLRRIVGLKDEFYHRHIIKFDLLAGVVNAFVRNGPRYNLLNSAIIELFEFIKTEDIRSLMGHLVRRHISSFEGVSYVQTFSAIKHKYLHGTSSNLLTPADPLDFLSTTPLKPDQVMDEDEESWFDQEDDPDDVKMTSPKLENFTSKFNPRNNCSLGRSPMPLYNNNNNNNKRNSSISFNLNFRQHLFNKTSPSNSNNNINSDTPHSTDGLSPEALDKSTDGDISSTKGGLDSSDSEKLPSTPPSNLSISSLSPSPLSSSSSSPSASPLNQSMFLDSPSSLASPSSSSSPPQVSSSSLSSPKSQSVAKTSLPKGLVDYDYEDDEEEEEEEDDDDTTTAAAAPASVTNNTSVKTDSSTKNTNKRNDDDDAKESADNKNNKTAATSKDDTNDDDKTVDKTDNNTKKNKDNNNIVADENSTRVVGTELVVVLAPKSLKDDAADDVDKCSNVSTCGSNSSLGSNFSSSGGGGSSSCSSSSISSDGFDGSSVDGDEDGRGVEVSSKSDVTRGDGNDDEKVVFGVDDSVTVNNNKGDSVADDNKHTSGHDDDGGETIASVCSSSSAADDDDDVTRSDATKNSKDAMATTIDIANETVLSSSDVTTTTSTNNTVTSTANNANVTDTNNDTDAANDDIIDSNNANGVDKNGSQKRKQSKEAVSDSKRPKVTA